MNNKKLIFFLSIIIIPTLILIIYLILSIDNSIPLTMPKNPIDNPNIKDTVRFELLKNLLQLFLIIIIGGMIAYFFKSREEAKRQESLQKEKRDKEQQNRNEIRIEYFNRLGKIYRNVKNIRRTLISVGLTSRNATPSVIPKHLLDFYCEQMKLLNAEQLSLECLKIESNSIPAIINLTDVSTLLYKMEDYIRQILKEFEQLALESKNHAKVNYSNLILLDEFTYYASKDFKFPNNHDKRYRFIDNFAVPYKSIIKIIGENLS